MDRKSTLIGYPGQVKSALTFFSLPPEKIFNIEIPALMAAIHCSKLTKQVELSFILLTFYTIHCFHIVRMKRLFLFPTGKTKRGNHDE